MSSISSSPLSFRQPQHWIGQRGNNKHLSHVAAASSSYHCHTSLSFAEPQDRWENKVLDVNEALTFTVIDSRNTKCSQHNRWIGGGVYRSQRRVYSGTLNWLAPGPLPDWNASIMWHGWDHNSGSCWNDDEWWEDETSCMIVDLCGHMTVGKQ